MLNDVTVSDSPINYVKAKESCRKHHPAAKNMSISHCRHNSFVNTIFHLNSTQNIPSGVLLGNMVCISLTI